MAGRKNLYTLKVKNKFPKILEWKQERMTNKDIAKSLGISEKSFYQYINDYPEFKELIEFGEKHIINIIENRLVDICLGGKKNIKKEIVFDENKDVKSSKIIENISLPSINAIKYYLDRKLYKIDNEEKGGNDIGNPIESIPEKQKEALSIRINNILGEMDKYTKD